MRTYLLLFLWVHVDRRLQGKPVRQIAAYFAARAHYAALQTWSTADVLADVYDTMESIRRAPAAPHLLGPPVRPTSETLPCDECLGDGFIAYCVDIHLERGCEACEGTGISPWQYCCICQERADSDQLAEHNDGWICDDCRAPLSP